MTIADKLNDLNDNIIVINNEITSQEGLIDQILEALNGKGISNAKATFSYTNSAANFLAPSTFYGCNAFHELIFPNTDSIGCEAFVGCDNLETVKLPVCASLDGGAFKDCKVLKEIEIPVCASISANTFVNCSALTTVMTGSQCASIGENAFNGCGNLTGLYAPQCTYIGASAFMYCTRLEEADFAQVATIGDNAFYASGIKSFIIPACCTHIGENAFAHCGSLTDIQYRGTIAQLSAMASGNTIQSQFFANVKNASGITCTDGFYNFTSASPTTPSAY